jgi:hypothetical protein
LNPGQTLQLVLQKGNIQNNTNAYTGSVLAKLRDCRTSGMGYHHYQCDNPDCHHVHYQYHGCRNRHCPSCNWQKQEEWMEARMNELLPVKYFHVVFTLPHELNGLVMGNREKLFKQLFDSASHCLLTLGKDPKWLGAMPSISAVLHTWGQQLTFHPHVHCIVSGGGVDKQLNWVKLKKKSSKGYLFPYDVMEPMFKKHFMRNLSRMVENNEIRVARKTDWQTLKTHLEGKQWIVYAKSPMGSVSQVVEYLARYAHKVAISNHRILEVGQSSVEFQYKDYIDNKKIKHMKLTTPEFIRRFEQHILPRGFVKMRHYGILGNSNRKKRVNEILKKMKLPIHPPTVKVPYQLRMLEKYGVDVSLCPMCKKGRLECLGIIYPDCRGSPFDPSSFEIQKTA